MLHNLCKIIFKYYIASSATTRRREEEVAAAVAALANLSTMPTDAIRGEEKEESSTRYQHNVLTATVFMYMCVCVCVFECICVFYFPSASAKKTIILCPGLGICGRRITLRLKAKFECSNF